MYIYLTMTVGSRAGVSFLLDPTEENRIGRDPECAIALGDPLCSRVHAIVVQDRRRWRIRDAGSRNGTYVNDQKIDEAVLADGHTCASVRPSSSFIKPSSRRRSTRETDNRLTADGRPAISRWRACRPSRRRWRR